jgi:hypothetical protein
MMLEIGKVTHDQFICDKYLRWHRSGGGWFYRIVGITRIIVDDNVILPGKHGTLRVFPAT